jgi:RNA polymerase sigma-70 factor (ECF subfamily)
MHTSPYSSEACGTEDPGPCTGPAPRIPDPDAAFVEIYERERAALAGLLCSMTRDPDAAEDICQEAFSRLHLSLQHGGVPDDPAAWLRRVGRNLVISRARRAEVAIRYAPRLHEPGGSDPTVSLVLERERVGSVRNALARIPEQERRLLLLAASGYSRAELGERLGVSPGAIRTRLHRARRQLLGELGFDHASR